MKYGEIINALKYSDLSSHGVFADELDVSDKEKLLYCTNQALVDLYTKYPLLQKELVIIQKSWITNYVIDKKYAFTADPQDPNWYIMDSTFDPYLGDLIKIVDVSDESGDFYAMNSMNFCKVANTPAPNIIQIPNPVDSNALFVSYRAKHPTLVDEQSDIHLPANWLPSLYALIAHKVYAGGTAPEHIAKSQEFLQKYELFCSQQRDYGMSNEDLFYSGCINFNKGGWM